MSPHPTRKPLSKMQSALKRATAFLTPSASSTDITKLNGRGGNGTTSSSEFTTAPVPTALFPTVDPTLDGDDCEHDCATCTIEYPKKFSIDEDDALYGKVTAWSTHMLVATGKTDWVRDVADEKGSVMEAVGKHGTALKNGKLMLSASNMPVPCEAEGGKVEGESEAAAATATTVLLLPAMVLVENIRPKDVGELLDGVVGTGVTNCTPVKGTKSIDVEEPVEEATAAAATTSSPPSNGTSNSDHSDEAAETKSSSSSSSTQASNPTTSATLPALTKALTFTHAFHTTPSPHRALILLCSQKTRDARCGQSAPLLRRELERHLRPLGLYRDLHDTRPGGVAIYFISHVGGHKYSANMIVYRRRQIQIQAQSQTQGGGGGGGGADTPRVLDGDGVGGGEGEGGGGDDEGATQGIWLARVRPEDCEAIVRFTVLQGKVVKPQRQLRGGFDRERGIVSW